MMCSPEPKTALLVELERIKRGLNVHPAYEAIVREAARLDIMIQYVSDIIVHDQISIRHKPSDKFAWAIYESGTDIIWWRGGPQAAAANYGRAAR